jgi:predicted lipid-binding transport protein (Tim44 family)
VNKAKFFTSLLMLTFTSIRSAHSLLHPSARFIPSIQTNKGNTMKKYPKILLVVGCCFILCMPQLADARAGGGSKSSGSMGGRTYQSAPSYGARPIERSITPQQRPSPAAPSAASPMNAAPTGFFNRHPILSGIAGGLLGASIANMLFGNSGSWGGGGGGGIFTILLWGGILYLLYRVFRSRFSGGGFGSFPNFTPSSGLDAPFSPTTPAPPALSAENPLALTSADYQAFAQLLEKIQLTWGAGDVAKLRQYLTPEMHAYFNEELSANSSRGTINRISDVVVSPVTSAEAWSEAGLDYATSLMKWRAIDFMARLDREASDSDYVASGDARQPVDAQEVWTFVRARDGGHWLLSAIQQVG